MFRPYTNKTFHVEQKQRTILNITQYKGKKSFLHRYITMIKYEVKTKYFLPLHIKCSTWNKIIYNIQRNTT